MQVDLEDFDPVRTLLELEAAHDSVLVWMCAKIDATLVEGVEELSEFGITARNGWP
jgi:hypothetical protein